MEKLIISHDAGFFSCCTIRLRKIIDFFNEKGFLPEVDSSNQWSNYKDDPEYADITHRLFNTKKNTIEKKNIIFSLDDTEDQFSDYSKINFEDVNFFVEEYFSPSDEIIERISFFKEKYNIDISKTISVLYRGNDKAHEIHLPSFDKYLIKINELKLLYPDYKLLIQTDENEFCDFMLKNFPESIVINELKRIDRSPTAIQFVTPIGERFNLAKNFLSIMFLISSTSSILTNKGNVGLWSCLFRGNTNNLHII